MTYLFTFYYISPLFEVHITAVTVHCIQLYFTINITALVLVNLKNKIPGHNIKYSARFTE